MGALQEELEKKVAAEKDKRSRSCKEGRRSRIKSRSKRGRYRRKALSDEDWMLADIRAEIHYMIQSFKCDSTDVDRPSFTPALLAHYYKMYLKNKNFVPSNFGCKTSEEV